MSFAVFAVDEDSLTIHRETGAYEALKKERIGIEDFGAILFHNRNVNNANDNGFTEKLAARARDITTKRFGLVKGLYIPLYLSSSCHNVCTYCGFSLRNKVERKTLNEGEIKKELHEIYEKGFRNILLVSGELDKFKNINYLAHAVAAAKDAGFHSIAVEIGALDESSARAVAEAGANSFVLYQETYHPETYRKVHIKGMKSDYAFRLAGVERAIDSGFKQVTIGFLAGLHDPLYESLALYQHLHYLKKKFWWVEFSVSFPRLSGAMGVNGGFRKVDDKTYARMLMAFRIAFPEVAINLSTRETPAFRDGMANICVTHLSVESKTTPGGYASKKSDLGESDLLEQFKVHDSRSLEEMTESLNKLGYDVHFKDWEMELNTL